MNTSERSQFPSIKLDQLVYVELESGNGGMMLSVSEEGFSFRAVTPVRANGIIRFSFIINGSEKLEGHGNIEWTQDDGKVAGLQFTEVTPQFQNALRTWLSQLSAPAVPSFSDTHADHSNVDQQPAFASAAFAPKVPDQAPAVEPPSALHRAGPGTLYPRASPEFASSNGSASTSAVLETPVSNARRTLPALGAWEYPKELHEPPPRRINSVAATAIAICFVALAIVVYGYHQAVGQALISLGQKMSSRPEAPASQPAKSPDIPKSQPEPAKSPDIPKSQPEPAQALTTENAAETQHPSSPQPGLVTDSGYRVENSANAEKANGTSHTAPAAGHWVDQPRNQGPADHARSLWSAVAQGDTAAEVALAKLYLIGGGVTKNCAQARVLLKVAAKKGNGEAIDKLAQLENQGCP